MINCRRFIDGLTLDEDPIFECESCGNHVCLTCALANREVCPNCFGRLFRIS